MKTSLIIIATLALASSGCALNDAFTAEFEGSAGPGPGQPDMPKDTTPDTPPAQCAPCGGRSCVRIAGQDDVLCQEADLSLRAEAADEAIARCFTLIPDDAAEEADAAQVTEAGEVVALSRDGNTWSIQRVGLVGQGALAASPEQLYSDISTSVLAPHALVVLGQGDQLHVEVLGVVPTMGAAPTLATASFSADTPTVTPVSVGINTQHVCPLSPERPLNFTALSTTTAPGQTRFVAAACVCDVSNIDGCTGSTKVLDWEGVAPTRAVTAETLDLTGARRLIKSAENSIALSGFLDQQLFIWERTRQSTGWGAEGRQVFNQGHVMGTDHCLEQGEHLSEPTPSAAPLAHHIRVRSSATTQTPHFLAFSAPRTGATTRETVLALTTQPRVVAISNSLCLKGAQAPSTTTSADLAIRDAIQEPGLVQLVSAETRQNGARGLWLSRIPSLMEGVSASSLRLLVQGYTLTPSRLFKHGNLVTITGQAKQGNNTFTFAVRVDSSGALVCRPE